ncbi:hypothetical protein [Flavihumibacter sp. ZG627]|uniref:hypothetical protein n=1 Tax=Flavihumibacter sp. ZG627 TaxID=1463156 RepID=UPI00057E59EE|nr:hypothetical protein [Flavihumibacter sp. ZG627]KIC89053.1 hypothetical protein HY58_18975 [Flavihumibacter sp. ZG627]
MIIKQTFSNHLKALWIAIFTTVLYVGVCWHFKFEKAVIIMGLCYYTLFVVPSFFLHISYYIRNKGMVAEILPDRIRLEKDSEETIIASSDIKEIVVYKSASLDKGGIPITPMEAYFFARVYCNNDKKYELTCLMDANIDKSIRALHGVKIFREKGLFNIV